MKTGYTQQEILLINNSSFAQTQWNKDDADDERSMTPEENLEELCANGMIKELLPEVFKQQPHKNFYLWEMQPGFSFLQLELSEVPMTVESSTSLNPHKFLRNAIMN